MALCHAAANKRLGLQKVPILLLVLEEIANEHVKLAPAHAQQAVRFVLHVLAGVGQFFWLVVDGIFTFVYKIVVT